MAMKPDELHRAAEAAFKAGDVEALVALYEPDAWLFWIEGPVQGREAIGAAWAQLLEMADGLVLDTAYAVETGELAMLACRWRASLKGGGELAAMTAEVARRQDDGSWRYVFDNADAVGALAQA